MLVQGTGLCICTVTLADTDKDEVAGAVSGDVAEHNGQDSHYPSLPSHSVCARNEVAKPNSDAVGSLLGLLDIHAVASLRDHALSLDQFTPDLSSSSLNLHPSRIFPLLT